MAFAIETRASGREPHAPDQLVTLNDSTLVRIRPIQPADAFRLRRMFDRLSPESVYQRFFAPVTRGRSAALMHLAGVDHELHESLVAESGGEILGVARFDGRHGEQDAEVAVIVEDAYQDRGLGTLLLHQLARVAARRGLSAFRAVVLGENRAALRFLRRLSPDAEVRFAGGEYVAYAPFRRNASRSFTR
jgi:GNAT superfamily N-acetyltransferase